MNQDTLNTFQRDMVSVCRSIVVYCRASGGRRATLRQVIIEGNAGNWFDGLVPVCQLLRDVSTRWSSTYFMINRFLELWPVTLV